MSDMMSLLIIELAELGVSILPLSPQLVPEHPFPMCLGLDILLEEPAFAKDHLVHQPCPILHVLFLEVGVVLIDVGRLVQVITAYMGPMRMSHLQSWVPQKGSKISGLPP